MRDYIGLHNHTEYSNVKVIDSINRFNRMVDYAWDLGLSGLALTDHDCLSGSLQALDIYKAKLKKEWTVLHPDKELPGWAEMSKELDFKIILGNEIYLSEEGLNEAQMDGAHSVHFWHLILLAKDEIGFRQLKELSSRAWRRAWFRGILRTPTYPSDLVEIIGANPGHIVCSTACLGGYAAWCWRQSVLAKNCDGAFVGPESFYWDKSEEWFLNKLDNHLSAMENLFGVGNFFIELQPNEKGSEQNEYNIFTAKIDGVIIVPTTLEQTARFTEKLTERQIPYVLLDSYMPDLKPLTFFGQDSFASGYFAAKMLMLIAGKEKEIALVKQTRDGKVGSKQQANRETGFRHYMVDHFPEIKITEVDLPLDEEKKEYDSILEKFFKEHPLVHHCITFNSKAHIVGQFLQRSNRRNIQIMGYDMVPKNEECVRQGSISFLIAQHAYQQGYSSVDALFNAIVMKRAVNPVNYMPIEILTKENVDFYRRTAI